MLNDDQWKALCDNTARQQDDAAPRRSRLAAGGVLTLVLAALFVMLLFLAPQAAWTVPLAAALIMLDVTIGLAVRQWARSQTSKYLPNGGTSARRRLAASWASMCSGVQHEPARPPERRIPECAARRFVSEPARPPEGAQMSRKAIDDCIRASVEQYLKDLRGAEPDALHDLFIGAAERPLLDVVLCHADSFNGAECFSSGDRRLAAAALRQRRSTSG